MDPTTALLLGLIAVAAFVGVGSMVARDGLPAVLRALGRELASIRALDVAGTGVRLLGVRPAAASRHSAATTWVTLCYLPIVPLRRQVVRFVDAGLSEARWLPVERTPIVWSEIGRTYLFGWLLFPLLLVAPFVLGGVLFELTRLHGRGDLPTLVRTAGTLVSALFILVGLVWFPIAIVRLVGWDKARRRPPLQ